MTTKSAPNKNLINCLITLEDGTKTHITALTKTGYKVEGRGKQVPMKYVRATKTRLVEDTSDKEYEVVAGLRVNLTRKQIAGTQEVEAPSLEDLRRFEEKEPKATKEPKANAAKEPATKQAKPKYKELEDRVNKLEEALFLLLGKTLEKAPVKAGPHYKFVQPSVLSSSYKAKLTLPIAAKKVVAAQLGLKPEAIKRGLLLNDRRNGLVTFLGFDKEELLYVFFDSKQKITTLSADKVAAASFTLATDSELDCA